MSWFRLIKIQNWTDINEEEVNKLISESNRDKIYLGPIATLGTFSPDTVHKGIINLACT